MANYDPQFKLYNARDAYVTLRCAKEEMRELKEFNLTQFYDTIVQPTTLVALAINQKGIHIDYDMRDQAVKEYKGNVATWEREVAALAGKEHLNVQGHDFARYLFDELHIPCGKRLKNGVGSVTKDVLQNIRARKLGGGIPQAAKIANLAIQIKEANKLVSTFLEGAVIGKDGLVHPSYKIGPATGRWACRKPNFMNVPKGIARKIYCAAPGNKFAYADFKALELRILAILANDQALLDVFEAGEDPHAKNAIDLFGLQNWEQTTDAERERMRFFAKMFIYLLNYGGGVKTIKEKEPDRFKDISLEAMQAMAARYLGAHPNIHKFRQGLKVQLYKNRTLYNAFGRPRVFFADPRKAVRSAYNFPMQSGAADLMNTKLIQLHAAFPGALSMQVHDSVILEVPESQALATQRKMVEILESPVPEFGGYSFPVDSCIEDRWGDIK